MAREVIIPDRVIPISLGVRGDRAQTDQQLSDALAALEREGFRAGPMSNEAITAMAKEIEMRAELGLDNEAGTFGHTEEA
jgi:hypothetical protein